MSDMPVFNRPTESNSTSEPNKSALSSKQSKTIRLNIDLTQLQQNRDGCVVLNYVKLLNDEKKRRARGDISGESDSKSDSKGLMLGENKYQSYAELGAGYDDDDSFIDNTEAYEECLPDHMDTKYGGYYINSGELVLKRSHGKRIESSPENETDSSSESEEEVQRKKKEPIKRDHDSSDSKKPHSDGERRKKLKLCL